MRLDYKERWREIPHLQLQVMLMDIFLRFHRVYSASILLLKMGICICNLLATFNIKQDWNRWNTAMILQEPERSSGTRSLAVGLFWCNVFSKQDSRCGFPSFLSIWLCLSTNSVCELSLIYSYFSFESTFLNKATTCKLLMLVKELAIYDLKPLPSERDTW